MKLNKILMSTLVGCSLLTPVILSSCSIKNSSSSSNNEEQKPKTVPVPFQNPLYDTWTPEKNYLDLNIVSAGAPYEIPNVDEWLNNESNNGRNFNHREETNGSNKFDVFTCSYNWNGDSNQSLFKTIDDFKVWIKSENNYEFLLYKPNVDFDNAKTFNFKTFNWDFTISTNCYIDIYIYFWAW